MPRSDDNTAMRERILETADRLFYGQGIRAVGVDTIAAEIGISKRTLYNYFPSKDELIVAYLARRLRPAPASDLPPAEQTLPFNGRQPNSSMRSSGGAIGGSYIFAGGFVGAAIAQFDSFYRIPGVEASETNTRIDMSQTKVTSKGEFRPDGNMVDAVRFWLGFTNYHHYELANEGGFDGIQQTFINRSPHRFRCPRAWHR